MTGIILHTERDSSLNNGAVIAAKQLIVNQNGYEWCSCELH